MNDILPSSMIHKKMTTELKKAQSQQQHLVTLQEIRKKRKNNGKAQYFVKWKRFQQKDNTWEPEENFGDQTMIQAFKKQLENQSANETDHPQTPILGNFMQKTLTYQDSLNSVRLLPASKQNYQRFDTTEKPFRVMSQNTAERDLTFDVPAPNMKVQGIYIDPNNNFWFNIIKNGQKRTISRQEAIKMNFYAVIKFYEKNIKFYPS